MKLPHSIKSSPFSAASLAIVFGIIILLLIAFIAGNGIIKEADSSGQDNHAAIAVALIGIFISTGFVLAAASSFGLVFSLIALGKKEPNKVLSIAGFVLNAAIVMAGLFVVFNAF